MDKTILLIVRASTDQQETESQKRELMDFCKSKGFVEGEMEIIEVAGASARKLNKKYIQMLEDIKNTILTNPSIKNVALWHLNRLGRVESKLHEMKEFFITNKIQLYVKEPSMVLFDDNGEVNAAGGIAFSVYASMVKFETDEMFAKMKRGKERNKEIGKYVGGNLKFGYKLDDKKYIIIDEDEATVVRQLFELYSTGKYSIYKLVDELNNRGLTSKKGLKFTYNIARKALVTERYYNGHLPLITKELFDKCTEVREKQMAVKFTKETRNVNFAVGLLKCSCGNNYVVSGDFYTCYSKVRDNRRFMESFDKCDSPIIRKDVLDNLLWLVTKRLQQANLMEVDSQSIEDYKEKIRVLQLKQSTATKEIDDISQRIEVLGDAYFIDGKMTEAVYNRRLEGLTTKQNQKESELKNYAKEIDELNKLISQTDLSEADRYLESLLLSDLDDEEIEDRKRIKAIMFDNIESINIKRLDIGKHHCLYITIKSIKGIEFNFIYDKWLNNHRKNECCIFFNMKPLYNKDGNIVELNKDVLAEIEALAGLPVVTNKELGEAAVKYASRELIGSDNSTNYTFIPDMLSFKEGEIESDDLKKRYNLADEEVDFISKTAEVFSVDEPVGIIKAIIDRFKDEGFIYPADEPFTPNIRRSKQKTLD